MKVKQNDQEYNRYVYSIARNTVVSKTACTPFSLAAVSVCSGR